MKSLSGVFAIVSAIYATVATAEPIAVYSETGSKEWGRCAVNAAPVAVRTVSDGPKIEWNADSDDPTLLAAQRLMALCSLAQDVERDRRDPNWGRVASALRRAKTHVTVANPAPVTTLRCVESLNESPFRYDIVRRTETGDAVVNRREFVYANEAFVTLPGGLRAAPERAAQPASIIRSCQLIDDYGRLSDL